MSLRGAFFATTLAPHASAGEQSPNKHRNGINMFFPINRGLLRGVRSQRHHVDSLAQKTKAEVCDLRRFMMGDCLNLMAAFC